MVKLEYLLKLYSIQPHFFQKKSLWISLSIELNRISLPKCLLGDSFWTYENQIQFNPIQKVELD